MSTLRPQNISLASDVIDAAGRTRYHAHIQRNEVFEMNELQSSGCDIYRVASNGDTPLHIAALWNCHDALMNLLSQHHPVNACNRDGNTPLHCAAANGYVLIMQSLLNAGASINVSNEDGCTALHLASAWDQDAAVSLLLQHDANMNVVDKNGNTPLHAAAAGGSLDASLILLQHGASTHTTNSTGQKPAEVAATPETKMLLSRNDNEPSKIETASMKRQRYAAEKVAKDALHVVEQRIYEERARCLLSQKLYYQKTLHVERAARIAESTILSTSINETRVNGAYEKQTEESSVERQETTEDDSELNAVRLGSFSLQAMTSQDSLDDGEIDAIIVNSSESDNDTDDMKNSERLWDEHRVDADNRTTIKELTTATKEAREAYPDICVDTEVKEHSETSVSDDNVAQEAEDDSELNAVRLGSFSLQAMASQDSFDDGEIQAVMVNSSESDSDVDETKARIETSVSLSNKDDEVLLAANAESRVTCVEDNVNMACETSRRETAECDIDMETRVHVAVSAVVQEAEDDSELNAVRLGSFSLQAMASQDSLDDGEIDAIMVNSSESDNDMEGGRRNSRNGGGADAISPGFTIAALANHARSYTEKQSISPLATSGSHTPMQDLDGIVLTSRLSESVAGSESEAHTQGSIQSHLDRVVIESWHALNAMTDDDESPRKTDVTDLDTKHDPCDEDDEMNAVRLGSFSIQAMASQDSQDVEIQEALIVDTDEDTAASRSVVTPLDLSDCESYADHEGVVTSMRGSESDTLRSESAYADSTNSKLDRVGADVHSVAHTERSDHTYSSYGSSLVSMHQPTEVVSEEQLPAIKEESIASSRRNSESSIISSASQELATDVLMEEEPSDGIEESSVEKDPRLLIEPLPLHNDSSEDLGGVVISARGLSTGRHAIESRSASESENSKMDHIRVFLSDTDDDHTRILTHRTDQTISSVSDSDSAMSPRRQSNAAGNTLEGDLCVISEESSQFSPHGLSDVSSSIPEIISGSMTAQHLSLHESEVPENEVVHNVMPEKEASKEKIVVMNDSSSLAIEDSEYTDVEGNNESQTQLGTQSIGRSTSISPTPEEISASLAQTVPWNRRRSSVSPPRERMSSVPGSTVDEARSVSPAPSGSKWASRKRSSLSPSRPVVQQQNETASDNHEEIAASVTTASAASVEVTNSPKPTWGTRKRSSVSPARRASTTTPQDASVDILAKSSWGVRRMSRSDSSDQPSSTSSPVIVERRESRRSISPPRELWDKTSSTAQDVTSASQPVTEAPKITSPRSSASTAPLTTSNTASPVDTVNILAKSTWGARRSSVTTAPLQESAATITDTQAREGVTSTTSQETTEVTSSAVKPTWMNRKRASISPPRASVTTPPNDTATETSSTPVETPARPKSTWASRRRSSLSPALTLTPDQVKAMKQQMAEEDAI